MHRSRRLAAVLLLTPAAATSTGAAASTACRAGQEWEGRFLAIPSPDNMREAMRRLSARPHHVGSAFGKESAEWMLARFREWGWEAQIETFDVLFPTPKERLRRDDRADAVPARARGGGARGGSHQRPEGRAAPDVQRYSTDGDVTGPLVYVNYGLPEDYDAARPAGYLREGQDRSRALRAFVARDQAEGGGRARGRRLSHLLRPARRRLLRGRTCSRRARCGRGTACSGAA